MNLYSFKDEDLDYSLHTLMGFCELANVDIHLIMSLLVNPSTPHL
jgi:hypothetical protein